MIASQQEAPRRMACPPFFINFPRFVLSPIAPIAMTIKNLDRNFKLVKREGLNPKAVNNVVQTEARRKNKTNIGKDLLKLNV